MAVRTIRIALCLNGGVSLAVWMSGVVHELDLVARASRGEDFPEEYLDRPGGRAEAEHFARWGEFCGQHRVRVVVDIVSGTSAGGLNGAILAKASAFGAPLPDLRDLWVSQAVLAPGQLLPNPAEPPPSSVLNGRYFARTIQRALAEIPERPRRTAAPTTLFLTATALGTADRSYRDAAGTPFDVPDHRRLYRFRSPQGYDYGLEQGFRLQTDNEFAGDGGALAQAARASAGFPGAFEPVAETTELGGRRVAKVGGRSDPSRQTYLVDGGVLDNAPLGPILEETARRRLDGWISRRVLYVVPSNGVLSRTSAAQDGPPGGLSVLGSGLGYPREADFRGDVDDLLAALRDSRRRITAARSLLEAAVGSPQELERLKDGRQAVEQLYREARVAGTLDEVRGRLATIVPGARPPLRSSAPPPLDPTLAPAWALSAEKGWQFGFSGASRSVRVLLSRVRDDIRSTEGEEQDLLDLATRLGEALDRIEALQAAVERDLYASDLVEPGDRTDVEIVDAVNAQFDALAVPETLDGLVTQAVDDYVRLTGDAPGTLREAMEAVEVVTGALAEGPEDQSPPVFGFVRLGPDVRHPALDDPGLGDDKLYGTRLQHFGAFGDPRWREWDWTWGRLDATVHLTRLLTTPDDVTDPPDVEEETAELGRQVLALGGETPASMSRKVGELARDLAAREDGRKDEGLLDQLRADPDGTAALTGLVDSALRFASRLRPPDPTDADAGPSRLELLHPLLASEVSGLPLRTRLLRVAAGVVRRPLWRKVLGGGAPRSRARGSRGKAVPARR